MFIRSVSEELADEIEELSDDCADLGARSSEIGEAVLIAYSRTAVT